MGAVPLVAEASLVALLAADPPVHRVARARARDRWRTITADAVLDTLEAAGAEALVLARPAAADAGACAVPALARTMGHEVVRLPAGRQAAARTVALAVRAADAEAAYADRAALIRALQVVAGLTGRGHAHADPAGLRPALLVRWARRAWRPCARCAGGGLPGGACGRCGEPLMAGPGAAA